jgi:hypothetical protein
MIFPDRRHTSIFRADYIGIISIADKNGLSGVGFGHIKRHFEYLKAGFRVFTAQENNGKKSKYLSKPN